MLEGAPQQIVKALTGGLLLVNQRDDITVIGPSEAKEALIEEFIAIKGSGGSSANAAKASILEENPHQGQRLNYYCRNLRNVIKYGGGAWTPERQQLLLRYYNVFAGQSAAASSERFEKNPEQPEYDLGRDGAFSEFKLLVAFLPTRADFEPDVAAAASAADIARSRKEYEDLEREFGSYVTPDCT